MARGMILRLANLRIVLALILSCAVIAQVALAQQELTDTKIEFTSYRELVPGSAGAIYKIKVANYGDKARTYELTPESRAVLSIGSYRIDPASKATIKPGREETFIFNLFAENQLSPRITIPLDIKSGSESTRIELAARPVLLPVIEKQEGAFQKFLKIMFYTLIAFIIIMLIITLLRRNMKRKEDSLEPPEVETYY
jgi:hypothetical protein